MFIALSYSVNLPNLFKKMTESILKLLLRHLFTIIFIISMPSMSVIRFFNQFIIPNDNSIFFYF